MEEMDMRLHEMGKFTLKMLVLKVIIGLLKRVARAPHVRMDSAERTFVTYSCPKKCSLASS
jgi:hypothetical protein